MTTFSSKLLDHIRQVTQEVPTSTLDSLIKVLMAAEQGEPFQMKSKLLQLLPRGSWRQAVSNLVDVWQVEAGELDGKAMAIALSTAAHCQTKLHQELSAELVWTGPNPASLPLRRTDQALLQLIRAAQRDLLIVSFAIYNIPEIVKALMAAIDRGVKVRIVAETPEASNGKIAYGMAITFGSQILERTQVYIWHKDKRPTDEQGRYGSLHAKCAVCDGQHLFISSANLTEYAMSLNIEMGVLIHNQNLSQQVIEQINSLISNNDLVDWKNEDFSR
ncbi:phospholipase [Oscillatoria sp. FACHB-1407]|uniref:DISARM system phospholipase D-like protein DrmC n=1 Tax=Oscillatoria sp. FACHB-1407 TaxID=2692847 RepID=UPI0016884942|nr:DISARM system phospholipase D-like protein DrmC [Oscillatoria sp. FACHB-1407]MBD2463391.1 phospholipase [Oscillatoria sp. FACHB-1407]